MKKITAILLILFLTACGTKGKKISIELKEGELKAVEIPYNTSNVVYEVSELGIVYPSVVGEQFLLKGIKAGETSVTVYKDSAKKSKTIIDVVVKKDDKKTGDTYQLKFNVVAPSTVNELYLSGSFNGWKTNDPDWKLIKEGNTFSLEKTIDVIPPVSLYLTIEYKYIADGFWEESDVRKSETIVAGDSKTFNDTITKISAEKAEDPNTNLRTYTVSTTFNVTAPEAAVKVYVTGGFNGWKIDEDWALEKVGTTFVLTKDFEVSNTTSSTFNLEYKYIINGFWEQLEGNRRTELKENVDKTITDTIIGIGATPAPGAVLDENTYTLNLTLTTPPVPNNVDIYLLGNVNDWGNGDNVSEWKLTKVSDTKYTLNITFTTGIPTLEFKFSNLGWSHGEKDASGGEIANRTLTLTETMTISLTVARWNQ